MFENERKKLQKKQIEIHSLTHTYTPTNYPNDLTSEEKKHI